MEVIYNICVKVHNGSIAALRYSLPSRAELGTYRFNSTTGIDEFGEYLSNLNRPVSHFNAMAHTASFAFDDISLASIHSVHLHTSNVNGSADQR